MTNCDLYACISKANQYAQENSQMTPIQSETGKDEDTGHRLYDIVCQPHTAVTDQRFYGPLYFLWTINFYYNDYPQISGQQIDQIGGSRSHPWIERNFSPGNCRNIRSHYVSDLIKKETGTSAQEYILVKTMAVAKELLADPSKSISDVAYALGYQYPQYFSRAFKRVIGCSPNEYRTSAKTRSWVIAFVILKRIFLFFYSKDFFHLRSKIISPLFYLLNNRDEGLSVLVWSVYTQ